MIIGSKLNKSFLGERAIPFDRVVCGEDGVRRDFRRVPRKRETPHRALHLYTRKGQDKARGGKNDNK